VVGLAAFAWASRDVRGAGPALRHLHNRQRLDLAGLRLARAGARQRWWPFVANGIIGLLLGVLTFAETLAVALVSLAGAWAILTGVLEVVAAVRFRQFIENEWLLGIGGVVSIVFGLAVLAQPTIGIVTFAWVRDLRRPGRQCALIHANVRSPGR
jgi:hypothetical protein